MILREQKHQNEMVYIPFPRYSLRFPDLSPWLETIRGDCVSKRRSQRTRNFSKKLNTEFLREELNTIWLVHLIENTLGYQQPYPQQPQQPYPQAPPMPSQQEMWAELQKLRQAQQQATQEVAEYQKKERMATYRVRRAKGSGNLSFNWGQDARGSYLTPSKFQDGRVTVAGAGMPATIQLQNTANGPFIVCTIQNGPLQQEEVELYNEWFVKPIEVIPARRGPRTGGQTQGAPTQQISQPAPQYAPPPQTQFAPQPQYAPPPVQPAFPSQAQQSLPIPTSAPQNPYQSIAHLDQNLQNLLVQEATTLQRAAPQAYPSLESALLAVKRGKNIP